MGDWRPCDVNTVARRNTRTKRSERIIDCDSFIFDQSISLAARDTELPRKELIEPLRWLAGVVRSIHAV